MIRKPRIDRFGQVHPPRRTVPVRLLVVVAVLLAISLGARRELQRFIAPIEAYEPPAMSKIEPGDSTTPLARHAVLLIVSGLRNDVSQQMPTLRDIGEFGAHGRVRVPWPTTPQAAWTTLLSGATPELSGTVTLFPRDHESRPITVDHLLRRARVTRHSTALAGDVMWESMIPTGAMTEVILSAGKSADDDSRLVQQAVDAMAAQQPDLMVIQISQVDTAGHIYGGGSNEYYRATQGADALIRRIASTVDLYDTLLVITSDHGHLDQGGYGGPEETVATVPFVMAGPGVKPGDYGVINQSDIAPTLAALLDVPIPEESQGTIRFEMLDMSPPLRAEKAMALATQQIRLSDAYLHAIGQAGTSGQPDQTLSVARSAWEISNAQSAFEIAQQSEQDARTEMTVARTARIAAERQERRRVILGAGVVFVIGLLLLLSLRLIWLLGAGLLAWLGPLGNASALATILGRPVFRWSPAVIGASLAFAAIIWAWRSRRWERLAIAAAAVGAGVLFAYVRPAVFSPSSIGNMEAFRTTMTWHSIAALLVGAGAALSLAWPTGQSPGAIIRTTYWFVFLLTAGLILELAAGYWLLGLTLTWYLPDANLVYWQLTGLMQTMLLPAFGILLPAIVVPIALVLGRLQRQSAAGLRVEAPEGERARP